MDVPSEVQATCDPQFMQRPLRSWLWEGLRAGFFLPPRIAGEQPAPRQVALLLLVISGLEIALARFELEGPASFDLRGWLFPWWSTGALLLLAWWVLPLQRADDRPAGLAAWFALWMGAVLPANTASQLLGIAQAHGVLPDLLETSAVATWSLYAVLWTWTAGAVLRFTHFFGVDRLGLGVLAAGMLLFGLTALQFPDSPWQVEQTSASRGQRLELTQELFETQQMLMRQAIAGIAPERRGVIDVYALVFSPYAGEDVFLRESNMVATVLTERFDVAGRVLQLANNRTTASKLPWATTLNLKRAIEGIAARMDREHDVLVVYLTSHAGARFQLAAEHEPLRVQPLSPGELRRMLDQAGIRNRVIAVSACLSGNWVGPLASETTLVMTAADANHTSYGCGRLSHLTFFGRAVFDEQLRATHSFEQAFAAAVPVIRRREEVAGKTDGFSNPQISVGEKIRPVLRELERRLDAAAEK
jgi:hypothetical protein